MIPDTALLFNTAVAAHLASTSHLQQAFTPHLPIDDLPLYPSGPFSHDVDAPSRTLGLQLLALDLLRAGLRLPLSPLEYSAYTVEFVQVGLKVLRALSYRGKFPLIIDADHLAQDLQDAVSRALDIRPHPHLQLLGVGLAIQLGHLASAKRLARSYQCDEPYRTLIHLALIDAGEHAMMEEISSLRPLLAIARAKALIASRRWDALPAVLDHLSSFLHWHPESCTTSPNPGDSPALHFALSAHHLMLRCLWEGRLGNDQRAKSLLKRLYLLMDESTEILEYLRSTGGILEVEGLLVQTTPANTLVALTFLTTLACRRDYIGPDASCKTLAHARAMREYQGILKKDDLWDTAFHQAHGLWHAWTLHDNITQCKIDVLVEEATALIYRSDFERAKQILHQLPFGIPLCLLYAQYAQFLGRDIEAARYYLAAHALLTPGSELGLMIEACLLAVQGKLLRPEGSVEELASRCRRSSNISLRLISYILSGIADPNLMLAKQKIAHAYDLCQSSNNNLLRALIFAFTSSTHLTGSEERVQKQLETGLDIATILGGKDRPDGVGQPTLGLWFACKLKSLHRRSQNMAAFNIARSQVQRHQNRVNQLMEMH